MNVGLAPQFDGLPMQGDFSPGNGLTTLTRTNPVALAASGDTTQNTPGPVQQVIDRTGFFTTPVGMLVIGIAALVAYKLWTERNGEGHVADVRVGVTNLLWLGVMVAVARHLLAGAAGVATRYNVPGSVQAAKFLTL